MVDTNAPITLAFPDPLEPTDLSGTITEDGNGITVSCHLCPMSQRLSLFGGGQMSSAFKAGWTRRPFVEGGEIIRRWVCTSPYH